MKTVLLFVLMILTVTASPVLALLAQSAPPADGLALVVAAPWGDSIGQVLATAGMADVFPTRAPIGAFVVLDTTQAAQELLESGAWFVMDGRWILELC